MNPEPKYQVSFSGQLYESQVAVGEHNTLEQLIGTAANERLEPTELQSLQRELASLRELVAGRPPSEQRDQALQQVSQLEAGTVAADEPQPRRLAQVYRWFMDNVPELAESVASLLLGPLVGKLVGGGAGAMAAALKADERHS